MNFRQALINRMFELIISDDELRRSMRWSQVALQLYEAIHGVRPINQRNKLFRDLSLSSITLLSDEDVLSLHETVIRCFSKQM